VIRLVDLMRQARRADRDTDRDPLERARAAVGKDTATRLEDEALAEVGLAIESAGGVA
jgi:hypothetical protein